MTFKEALFFTGKCLTINHEKHNKLLVEEALKKDIIDWDMIVKVSTAHYVFPALYCNLKKANFLEYLPEDLVAYMKHITDLNRDRNSQIIEQAKEINNLLLENNITPIFLKGTGNLLEGLYDDIAERMVGDIDFLVSLDEFESSAQLLKNTNYSSPSGKYLDHRHHPRLTKKDKIAAVEIHKGLLIKKYSDEFNFEIVSKDYLTIGTLNFLSYKNQLSLSIIAKQINDNGQFYNNIALRNSYDVFLLSQKTDALNAIKKFNKLFTPLNNFLAITKFALNSNIITVDKNKSSANTIKKFDRIISKQLQQKTLTKRLFITKRLSIIYKSFFSKEYRSWLFYRVTSKQWQREKLVQLGLKKTKSNL